MELSGFIQIGLPVALALIMLSMGLTLTLDDFRRVAVNPGAFGIGFAAQMLLVPLIALLLVRLFDLPPLLAVGLMVLSFCPGGTTSNLFSYLARADVALSISLTAVASLVTPFTIPLLTELTLEILLGSDREVSIPVGQTMLRLAMITLLPVSLGMLWRARFPASAARRQTVLHRLSVALFIAVIGAIIVQQWHRMPGFLAQTGAVSLTMIVVAMAAGYLLARAGSLGPAQTRTVSIEVGMQNGGMALVVTQGVLQNTTMSIVPVIYGLLMLIPVLLLVVISRGWNREPVSAA